MSYRRITSLILTAVMLLSFAACTPADAPGTDTVGTGKSTEPAQTEKVTQPAETEYTDPYEGVTFTLDLMPEPLNAKISENGSDTADCGLITLDKSDLNDYGSVFTSFGFSCEEGGGGLHAKITADPALGEEEYKLNVKKSGIEITASGRRGVFYAVSTLAQLRWNGRLAAAEITDTPAVPYRGVIEGFYGETWTHQYRLDLFAFMGKYKLNTYIYAPKDDPKHRSEWRSLYTGRELEKMNELIKCATENNVHFVYALSPGLDMDLGAGYDTDFAKLVEKCESMYGLGVRDFAILLDDIPTLDAQGHAKLVNDFQSKFVKTHDGCTDLIMITPEFCTATMTGYSNKIAPLIDPDIMIMWTGYGVIPPSISAAEMANVNSKFGRKMYIWWNYPVNDYAVNELFMGPCENLDSKLDTAVSGLVSNPMNQGYASFLPLITVADYLWDPITYEPEEALNKAVKIIAPECSDGLYTLTDLTRNTAINGSKSTFTLKTEIEDFNKNKDGAAGKLLEKLDQTAKALADLLEKGDKKLIKEVKPWLKKAELYVDAAKAYVRFSTAGEDEKESYAMSFAHAYAEIEKSECVVSPDVLTPFLSSARQKINSVFGKAEAIRNMKASTTLNTYADYHTSYAVDGDDSTWFWSAGEPAANSTFTVDLGDVTDVSSVRLRMGTDDHATDYIAKGVIEYSADGKNYTRLCDTAGRDTQSEEPFSARYVRVRCLQHQVYWIIITEFEIRSSFDLPEGVSFDGGADLRSLFDKSLFTVFSPSASSVRGKTIEIDLTGRSEIKLFLLHTNGVSVSLIDKSGKQNDVTMPDTDHEWLILDIKDKIADSDRLRITFGSVKAAIAEIVVK